MCVRRRHHDDASAAASAAEPDIVVPDDQIRSSVVVEVGLADNVIITGRMYVVCNVSGRGKADSVVLHGRWFQVELHGGSSICGCRPCDGQHAKRSDAHTSELQSLMRISYAVFCL